MQKLEVFAVANFQFANRQKFMEFLPGWV